MHPELFEMRLERARDGSMQVQNHMIKLRKNLINCHTLFARHGMRPECMWDASGMHANVTLELSCTVRCPDTW